MSDANFLASMTFASGEACNCDECDCGPSVPLDIQRAVQEHLRKRKLEEPVFESSQQLNIQQQRELVKRESGVSVWKLVLPRYHGRGADPIVEFRNSHRVLFVKKMPQNATIQSIGKGIIGSAAEESGRTIVNWKQCSSYFLPCLSGVACGWVNTTQITEEKSSSGDSDDANNPSGGDSVVLYTMKVSPRDLERNQKEDETQQLSPWVAKAVELFDSMSSVETSDEIMLSSEESAKVSEIFDLVLT
ncbi:hypothetical protein QTG54_002767 [Skeletonema marinoi]|uniref:Uncharacterized protein n=1 Tax=Skeletonema marinoi TaxID=267567 RepID=A0AAD9DHL7_9STRA|nr:hypothetical protein QTG54_002767 [Skeletonema marinoi]